MLRSDARHRASKHDPARHLVCAPWGVHSTGSGQALRGRFAAPRDECLGVTKLPKLREIAPNQLRPLVRVNLCEADRRTPVRRLAHARARRRSTPLRIPEIARLTKKRLEAGSEFRLTRSVRWRNSQSRSDRRSGPHGYRTDPAPGRARAPGQRMTDPRSGAATSHPYALRPQEWLSGPP